MGQRTKTKNKPTMSSFSPPHLCHSLPFSFSHPWWLFFDLFHPFVLLIHVVLLPTTLMSLYPFFFLTSIVFDMLHSLASLLFFDLFHPFVLLIFKGDFDTMLKSNEPNSISKDVLRDEGCSWFINCTTQRKTWAMWNRILSLIPFSRLWSLLSTCIMVHVIDQLIKVQL